MATEIAPRELTPPPIQAPTAKEKKYDRQLRLWAASGQRALEESHVLLIIGEGSEGSNSSVSGAETLKNLVLPSIGNFTIADAATVQEADLGVNFFLEPSSITKSRAEEMRRLLEELNPDVSGHAITRPLAEWLPQSDSLKPYNLLIVCGSVSSDALKRLCDYSSLNNIPTIYIQCAGFFSGFSIQLPREFPIVDSHPDPDSTQDLRLLRPWAELSNAVKKLGDITKLPNHEHGHIPYLLILLYYLQDWQKDHDNNLPATFKDKTAFRDFVRSQARIDNPEGGEENFDEACAAVLKSISEPPVGSGCKDMFAMDSCTDLQPTSANFWLIAHAIKDFYTRHKVLPLPGSVPDMKATSEVYINLQTIYKSKARQDVAEVTATVRELEQTLQAKSRTSSPIAAAEIEAFCKNASHVRVLTNTESQPILTLRFMNKDPKGLASLKTALEMDFEDMLPIYIALNQEHLGAETINSLTENEEKQETLDKHITEVSRVKGGELHNIASVTGGLVAQEAIKLLTRQYVPVEGICIFDGIRAKVGVVKI